MTIDVSTVTGLNLYALIRQSSDAKIADVNDDEAFETFAGGSYADYALAMTEQGSSGFYSVAVPAWIASGIYTILVKRRIGGSPAQSDPDVASGTIPISVNSGGSPILTGTTCEFLLTDPLYLGEDTNITLSPFEDGVDTTGWTYSLFFSEDAHAEPFLTLEGPDAALSDVSGVFTAILTAEQMDPAETEGLAEGTIWLALWRTNDGNVECLTSGPVKVAKLPGLPPTT